MTPRATSRTTGRTRRADLGQVVAEALADLPAARREVFVLIDLLGLSAERAGERLEIGACATKSRLHRARKALGTSTASLPWARKTA